MSDNRSALVTGASRGLGAAIVSELLRRDYRVMAVARSEHDLRRRLDALDAAARSRADWMCCDLSDPQAALGLFDAVQHRFGPIDVLINNAGAGSYKPLRQWSPEEVIGGLHLNLLAPMLLARAALPGMIERRRGTIVNIASDLSRRPLANMAPYVAAKHGLLGFAASLQREVRAHGIKVCTVMPGVINSAFNGATEGSRADADALDCAELARRIADLLDLPPQVLVDEITIHPLQQDY